MNTVIERMLSLGDRCIPTVAWVEVTHRCNATCRYCYIRDHTPPPDLPLIKIFQMIDKLSDSGVFGLVLTGGEPFVRTDFLSILQRAVDADYFHVALMTNGTLMSPKDIAFLTAHASIFRNITMSTFSHRSEINDAYFGVEGASAKILENATALKDGGVKVHFNLNVLDINIDSFLETRDFFRERGFEITFFYPPVLHARVGDHEYFERHTSRQFYRDFLGRLSDGDLRSLASKLPKAPSHSGLCAGRRQAICVDPRGELKPCPTFTGISMGSIFDSAPLRETLANSALYRRITSLTKDSFSKCIACSFAHQCMPCVGLANSLDPTMTKPYDYKCTSMEVFSEVIHERGIMPESSVAEHCDAVSV